MIPDAPIGPTALRDYAVALGWMMNREAARHRVYALENARFPARQLVFPMDETAPDYAESVERAVTNLAALEGLHLAEVHRGILTAGDDALAFRVATPGHAGHSLPLSFVTSMLLGAQQLLLAAGCTALRPQRHHPRLSRAEAQQFVEASRFQHTEPGSFVLNVSCPVHAVDVQMPLPADGVEVPFVRRATVVLYRSLVSLVSAIEADTVDALVRPAPGEAAPLLSSNFCEALGRFADVSAPSTVDIQVAWAASVPLPPGLRRRERVRVQRDYFPRIEEVRRALRPAEGHTEDVFYGTVERLDGEMTPDGRRAGEVILSLLSKEGETVRARASLDADQYLVADRAHMTDRAFVRVAGRLHPGRQPRLLDAIRLFEAADRSTS